MKFNKCKAIILLLLIILSEGFDIQKKGKINRRNKIGSNSRVRYNKVHKTVKKGRSGSHYRRADSVCQIGFGFEGYTLQEVAQSAYKGIYESVKLANMNESTPEVKVDVNDTFTQIIDSLLNEFSTKVFNVALGDFTGSRISQALSGFTCNNLPVASDQTVGIFGLYVNYLPCPQSTEIKICFMFDRCGTFGLSLNSGLVKCILTLMAAGTAGVSLIIAKIVGVISSAAFAFSFHEKLSRKVNIVNIIAETETEPAFFQEASVTVKGHIAASVGLSIPVPKIKVGEKTLDEYIGFSGSANTITSFGKVGNIIRNVIENIKSRNSLDAFVDILKRAGIEVAINISEKFKFKLNKLTKGLLPDLDFALPAFTFLFTSGCGSSGLTTGIYVKHNINIGDAIKGVIIQALGVFNAIFKVIGFDTSKMNFSDLNFYFSIVLNAKYIGFSFDSSLVTFKCLYGIETSKGGCEVGTDGLKKLFTVLYDSMKWLLIEVDKFFQEVGNIMGVIAEGIMDVINKTRQAMKDFLVKMGKTVQNFVLNEAPILVKDAIVNTGNTIWNWFTSWRRRRIRRMMRMKKFKKMRRFKKMRYYH